MKKLFHIFFSMTGSVVLLVIFAASIGYVTFIENAQGTEIARRLVYDVLWFEVLLVLLIINLLGSVVRYQILNKQKFSVLLFHLAFIIILIGAGITRYFGSEGTMHIREGETSNEISSDKTSVRMAAQYKGQKVEKTVETLFSENGKNDFSSTMEIGGKTLLIEHELFILNAVETIVPVKNGDPAISLFVMNTENRGMDFILLNGEDNLFEGVTFAFEDSTQQPEIEFFRLNDELHFKTKLPIVKMGMMEQNQGMILPGSINLAEQKTIYKTEKLLFVLKTYLPQARKNLTQIKRGTNESGIIKEGKNALVFRVSEGNTSVRVNVLSASDGTSMQASCKINDVKISINYGMLTQKLPFSITLHDFVLERYPGSHSPSSYSSEITVVDPENKTELPYRIYMNNILKYRGYRFFQSSYDADEQGTILSVSNDYWGTLITYIGYFLLMFGMILTLFNKNSRFRTVLKLSSELQQKRKTGKILAIAVLLSVSGSLFASNSDKQAHIKSLNSLLIQDQAQGRIEPFSTFASDVFRKVSKQTSYNALSPTEVVLSMISNPETWQNEPIIKVGNQDLATELGAIKSYVSFNQLFDFENDGAYRLSEKVEQVYHKEQSARNKYDKELLNVDERVNICYQIFEGKLLNIFPDSKNIKGKWNAPQVFSETEHTHDANCQHNMPLGSMPPPGMGGMSEEQINAIMEKSINTPVSKVENTNDILFKNYLMAVSQAYNSGNWTHANLQLTAIKNIQQLNGGSNIPSSSRINLEIIYNELNIFGKMRVIYIIMGLFLLILHFVQIFKPKSGLEKSLHWSIIPFIIVFAIYTLGLVARWYISDHAPWSNGYETIIFVGWAAALSGLIFARRSPVSLAVTGILSAIALFVAGMSWMNPEITPLVPVLKSFWLIIHVAIITSSYGFLAMGALLGLLNLILMIFRNEKNSIRLKDNIQEISYIIELSLMIGLVMLTAGCFIGGVWANESWGRYWGWDPKETWALVSILVYSAILHLRNVPKLNNQFVLSSLALVGFSSIIMTFFGVNYYLSGMHSYGQGTPPPIPLIVYFIIIGLLSIIYWAYKKEKTRF
ncbi:MAG: cytochrome c biogenesis protein CcsA [Paludibacter sp.]|nr:cytochrome c biogenesis protein CcsA [Paludibacter sp.]